MTWCALAPHPLFFKGAPAVIHLPVIAAPLGLDAGWLFTIGALVVGFAVWRGGRGFSRFDQYLLDLIQRYDAPRETLLYLTERDAQTEIASLYWPAQGEACPAELEHRFGLILLDGKDWPGVPPTWFLDFCFDALVFEGKILVRDRGKIVMVIRKDSFSGV